MTIHSLTTHDLFARTERVTKNIAHLAVDTRVTFTINDIVDAVERELPAGYPAPTVGATRRDLIGQIAQSVLSEELYENP
ncbi:MULTISPECIES: hypothetical protein [Streptomyces]|uniref:Uncharacterized protein n=1 Tax=Streptomyces celluloflavus TaxID=58344 RepID=A0ABW7REQ5_9ACTN|nr:MULTISPECIES: hypothetical protein [Streptomyces]MYU54136.1 hypothetical protein [Streptomyces sp. SID7805]